MTAFWLVALVIGFVWMVAGVAAVAFRRRIGRLAANRAGESNDTTWVLLASVGSWLLLGFGAAAVILALAHE
jgi:hypothetical protein